IFGYNAPGQYMESSETPAGSGNFVWHLRTIADYGYTPPVAKVLELDAKYEGIAAGSRLLICQPSRADLVTVTGVSQGQATFLAPGASTSPSQDTVPRVALDFAPPIADRRTTVLHEVKSPRIRFWGYRYPDTMSGSTVYVPARRIDADNAEIGRAIQNN